MREIERMIAEELASMIRPYMDSSGEMKFSEEVEVDSDTIVFVDGVVSFRVGYNEPVNYYYNADVSVCIDGISVYDSEGNVQKLKFNQSAIERYLAQSIED